MEKKKLKLSISGASKKTINSIEQARSQSKNTVVIEKRSPRYGGKSNFSRGGARSIENKYGSFNLSLDILTSSSISLTWLYLA